MVKIILIAMLLLFTFITMCGGNPLNDKYGFRYWHDPGPIVENNANGASGQRKFSL